MSAKPAAQITNLAVCPVSGHGTTPSPAAFVAPLTVVIPGLFNRFLHLKRPVVKSGWTELPHLFWERN